MIFELEKKKKEVAKQKIELKRQESIKSFEK